MQEQRLTGVAERYDPAKCQRLLHLFDSLFPKLRVHLYDHFNHAQWEYLFDGSRKLARQAGKDSLYYQLSFRLAIIFHRQTKYRQAIPIMEEALRQPIWTKEQEELLLRRIEHSYRWSGAFREAIAIRRERIRKGYSSNFWEMYDAIGAYTDAIQEFKNKEPRPDGKPFALALYHNQLGTLYLRNQQVDSALLQFHTMRQLLYGILKRETFPGMDNYSKNGRWYFYNLAWGQIGRCYAIQGNYVGAIPLLQQDIKVSRRLLETDNRIVKFNVLASCFLQQGRVKLAAMCLDSVAHLMEGKTILEEALTLQKNRAMLAKASGDMPRYLALYDRYLQQRDSMLTENQRNQNIFTLAYLEIERNRLDVLRKNQQLEIAAIRADSQRRRLLQVCVGAFLVMLILLLVYINKRSSSAYEKELAVQQERHRISADLHDDFSASLSALYLYLSAVRKDAAASVLQDRLAFVTQRVRELTSQLRELIWSVNTDHDHLDATIAYMVQQVQSLLVANGIRLQVGMPDANATGAVVLKGATRRYLYLSVKEGAHNILKHAKANEASLRFEVEGRQLTVSLADNGIGLSNRPERVESSGLQNMRRHMLAVGGSVELRNDAGLTLVFRIPL